jgi:hypothetical protein
MGLLRNQWEPTITSVGLDVMIANEAQGYDARITSRDNIPKQDDDSVGESIATALTGYLSTFTLPDDDDETLYAPPAQYQGNRSYADAAKNTDTKPPTTEKEENSPNDNDGG